MHPALARACRELLVFQRTPASVDVRGNQPIDPQWFTGVATPGWQERWLENFCAVLSVSESPAEDLVGDAWTDLATAEQLKPYLNNEGRDLGAWPVLNGYQRGPLGSWRYEARTMAHSS